LVKDCGMRNSITMIVRVYMNTWPKQNFIFNMHFSSAWPRIGIDKTTWPNYNIIPYKHF